VTSVVSPPVMAARGPHRERGAVPFGERLRGLAFGGDYNAEQWPEATWDEDIRLMREAGVTMMTLGVFSWALLEPAEGQYEFGWLDRLMDRLEHAGIVVDLATPTASPPPWFALAHPDALPMTRDGRRLTVGAREHFCPSAPAYRAAAIAMARQLAMRYGGRPHLALWHVNNEMGAHVGPCYCPVSKNAFVDWLRRAYGDVDALNDAWGTTFWGQRYGDWGEVDVPRLAPMPVNPAQQLDFARFSSEQYLECFRLERGVLHELSPGVPVTTNFMANNCKHMDYWAWVEEVDVVTNDHYLPAEDPAPQVDLAMSADLARGLARGRPWLLLEHSTSAVNWQPRNLAKPPGELRRNSLSHVARGSEGAMFFQWRASRFGGEKFHSAMVPQAGTDSDLWRDVVALGADLGRLAPLRGSTVSSRVAVVWDWQSWWALELEFRPSCELSYAERMRTCYEALWRQHVTVDFVPATGDLAGYAAVVVPSLYLVTPEAAASLRRYVEGGGHLLMSYFSGIVDGHDTVPVGPYPGMVRDLLGLTVEEFHPLAAGEQVVLDDGTTATVWSEKVVLRGATSLLRFADGPDAGCPALTRHRLGSGTATYLATHLALPALRRVLSGWLADFGVPADDLPEGVEVVRRRGDGGSFLVVVNHTDAAVDVPAHGQDLLTDTPYDGSATVVAGGVLVLAETVED
jgi:beta-galactosidase